MPSPRENRPVLRLSCSGSDPRATSHGVRSGHE